MAAANSRSARFTSIVAVATAALAGRRAARTAPSVVHAAKNTAGAAATALVATASLFLLAGCGRSEPTPEPVRAVRTIVVSVDSAAGAHEYAAEVRARVESRLGFRVGGKLVARPAEVGRHVETGEVLARIDPADLILAQQAAAAATRAAQTQVDLATAEVARYRDLRAQNFISALELERRESALAAQRAQLDQALAQARAQGNQAAYAALTAPAAGVVTAVEAEVGAVLAAGTPVVRLAHDGPRDVVFAVPEDTLAAMRERIGRAGALQVRVWGGTPPLRATVREVAAAADPVTRTFLVKADVGDATLPNLALGRTATVVAELPQRAGVALLPTAAVMQQQGQTAVWLVDRKTMTVRVQPVTVAGADGNRVVVSSGLAPGQTVVTAGVHALTPGQKVQFYVEPGTAPPQQQPAPAPAASR